MKNIVPGEGKRNKTVLLFESAKLMLVLDLGLKTDLIHDIPRVFFFQLSYQERTSNDGRVDLAK